MSIITFCSTYDVLQTGLGDGKELLIGLDREVAQGADQVIHISRQGNQCV